MINKEHQSNNSNNLVDIEQFNQEQISLNCLTAKDVTFGLLWCQTFNRDHCGKRLFGMFLVYRKNAKF